MGQVDIAYTNQTLNELTIKCNLTAYRYRVAHSPTAYNSFSPSDSTGWTITPSTQFAVTDPTAFTTGDGTKAVYVQFVDMSGSKFAVRSDTVVLDQPDLQRLP